MRNRPWPLVLLALIQILTPAFNILFNAWALQVRPDFILGWVLERSPIEVFEALALMPIAGVAIFLMKRWSYLVFFATMGWSLSSNLRHLGYAKSTLPIPMLLAVYGGQIALGLYFLLPSVRKTYFDPRVRWWESKPRYVLRLPVTARFLGGGRELRGHILNLSEGGMFVQVNEPVPQDSSVQFEFSVLDQPFRVAGKAVHTREVPGVGLCMGVQFVHDDESARRVRDLTRALECLGFQDRVPAAPMLKSLGEWAARLVRTGRGLTPEVGRRG